jgi:GNAT superfamily N-acetyltransferase
MSNTPRPSQAEGFSVQTFTDITSVMQLGGNVPGMIESANSAFGYVSEEETRHHLNHMVGDQVLVAAEHPGLEVVGWSAVTLVSPEEEFHDKELESDEGLYIAAVAVHRIAQGKGLSSKFHDMNLTFGLDKDEPFAFTRTQNPRIEASITHAVDRLVDAGAIGGYTLSRTVREGIYGKMLTSEQPASDHLAYNDIDYDRGDAAVIQWTFR